MKAAEPLEVLADMPESVRANLFALISYHRKALPNHRQAIINLFIAAHKASEWFDVEVEK